MMADFVCRRCFKKGKRVPTDIDQPCPDHDTSLDVVWLRDGKVVDVALYSDWYQGKPIP